MNLAGMDFGSFFTFGALLGVLLSLVILGNLLYEIAKNLFDLEETLAWRKNEGWNPVKTSTVFLGLIVLMQGFTVYTTLNTAAEPLIEEGKIVHWIELYKVEETLDYYENYDPEEDWYIRWKINGFLQRGLMDTGFLLVQLSLFFQGLYRGTRKKRLTERGLYTEEGRRKLSNIDHYKVRYNKKEKFYELTLHPQSRKFFRWKSKKPPKKVDLDIEKRDLPALKDLFRLEDIKKEETS
jgi:hypothetical protein